ncbi:zinc-binding dehydrogenase [Agrobacterium sp. NPDC090283]|uniref:zinc-dependent alcohol dehydrogenase n=1 Tax=Agrobacterium sp. NPDC090283 TaxID=3363920 RepID=UPI00383AD168
MKILKADVDSTSVAVLADDFGAPIDQGQVKIKITRSAICGTDAKIVNNVYPWRVKPMFPIILGHEGVGVVVDHVLHSGDPDLVGKRVVPFSLIHCGKCQMCTSGRESYCLNAHHLGISLPGTFAPETTVPADRCVVVPDEISDEDACMIEPLAVAAHTFEHTPSLQGKNVAIIGAGPLGLLHLLAANALQARSVTVFGSDRGTKRLAQAKNLGANACVAVPMESNTNIIKERYSDNFDVVVECGRLGSAAELALSLAKTGATVCFKGIARGSLLDPLPIIRKGLTVSGQAGASPDHYLEAIKWCRELGVRPGTAITRWYALEDGEVAFRAMCNGYENVGFIH